jgi:predicted Rossmann-fold nucleotide-binding protein
MKIGRHTTTAVDHPDLQMAALENSASDSSPIPSVALKICVFASSSPKTHEKFREPAYLLGQLIARAGHVCLTGAGAHGCMGAVNSGARSENGRIMGVSHELFRGGDTLIEDKIICKGDDLAERRRYLLQHADLILVLPGSDIY